MTNRGKAARPTAVTEALSAGGSEALVGVQALICEMEGADPGSPERLRANVAQRYIVQRLSAFARR